MRVPDQIFLSILLWTAPEIDINVLKHAIYWIELIAADKSSKHHCPTGNAALRKISIVMCYCPSTVPLLNG
jgi:hypothetical protein